MTAGLSVFQCLENYIWQRKSFQVCFKMNLCCWCWYCDFCLHLRCLIFTVRIFWVKPTEGKPHLAKKKETEWRTSSVNSVSSQSIRLDVPNDPDQGWKEKTLTVRKRSPRFFHSNCWDIKWRVNTSRYERNTIECCILSYFLMFSWLRPKNTLLP